MTSDQRLLSLSDFARALSEHVGQSIPDDAEARMDDLGLDSVSMLIILVVLEDCYDVDVPVELWGAMRTIGDVYHHYETRIGQRG